MQIRRVPRDYLATALMDVSFLEVNLTFCFSCQKGGGLCGPLCLWMTEDACCTSYMPVNPSPVQSGGSLRPQFGSPLIVGSWEGIPSGRIQLTVLSTGSTSNHRSKIFRKKKSRTFQKAQQICCILANTYILLTLYLQLFSI